MNVGIIFITHEAKKHLPRCLPPVLNSRVLVVNSSSNDGTVELAQAMGAETLLIPRHEFNHGATREKARKYLNTDIVVMMTPDAYAQEGFLEKLIAPLIEKKAVITYARQIPHDNADFFEAFPRTFNYPTTSELRSQAPDPYTYFCSNTCAAYLNSALDEIGGFAPGLFGEDTIAVEKLLKKGHSIAYVAEAIVKHSHRYTLKQEFKRHFDIGLTRPHNDSKRGRLFAKKMLQAVPKRQFPYALLHLASKWLGYRIGKLSVNAPLWWKRALSSQDFYWRSKQEI